VDRSASRKSWRPGAPFSNHEKMAASSGSWMVNCSSMVALLAPGLDGAIVMKIPNAGPMCRGRRLCPRALKAMDAGPPGIGLFVLYRRGRLAGETSAVCKTPSWNRLASGLQRLAIDEWASVSDRSSRQCLVPICRSKRRLREIRRAVAEVIAA